MATRNQASGYSCEFVGNPPKIQSDCPICLQILRIPQQVTCCGYSFCKKCIEPVRYPCPCCKKQEFKYFHNKGLQRYLHNLEVYCSNKREGCQWVGELGQLDNHLNIHSSTPEQHLEGCQFVQIRCYYCSMLAQRSRVKTHQEKRCLERPYKCEHCDHIGTYHSIIELHIKECLNYPIQCPNKCGSKIPRKDAMSHISDICLLTIIDCEFKIAGCQVQRERRYMPAHLKENLSAHSLLLQKYETELRKVEETVSAKLAKDIELVEQHKRNVTSEETLRFIQITREGSASFASLIILNHKHHELACAQVVDKCNAFKEDINVQQYKINQLTQAFISIKQKVDNFLQESDQQAHAQAHAHAHAEQSVTEGTLDSYVKQKTAKLKHDLEIIKCMLIPPVSLRFIVKDFIRLKSENKFWESKPFYTHPTGYKMCLRVYANGFGDGYGAHTSLFIIPMQGEFDEILEGPFKGKITIQLLNQEEDKGHISHIIEFNGDGMTNGSEKFIPHANLEPNYLHCNCLKLCIQKITQHKVVYNFY